ncbi:putative transcription factor ZF-HD family [Helianthus annuus]|uniref:Putative ZF-HD homeobox protein, Cys/His-rich dimerization domain-containing protein n=1 Tax=Helianthus annuus TaxID=4232 RepID=A0A251T0R2_HELAN|nr:zinc-finger homeodomain protein 10 [Helianthus annuus]KAF5777083.1 putative transcription factor ZF-HD family [Helianthus annuus]KAJ0488689.1 putative transcription factor ZF-HD family [Helianthus annuus]KAJ0492235.1 putative transcription factor ZF-HD family [Helianthus annuus]KAJ0504520.1 putative transcription factor ZF-HD family [Helianthus annuus]KAJ0861903.1 putative transcription factor ZF-HD family [Helianthus annuus]
MDLKHTTTTTTTNTTADSPDTDGETPLHSQLIKPFSSFPNGKNHHHHRHQQPPPQSPIVSYKECLKNHAATIGSHALDGCGEFMPSLTTAPHEPTSLKCAACGCHRNFHRREHINDMYTYAPHVLLSFNSPDQTQMVVTPGTPAEIKIENPNGRKRFRTKFSQDQKDKMYLFAEKVGWKMQRCDDKVVADFCNEVGIKRGIFKVWMHNNKNTFGKKDKETSSPATATVATTVTTAGGTDKSIEIYNNRRIDNVSGGDDMSDSDQEKGGGSGGGDVHLQASNNGSSCSC